MGWRKQRRVGVLVLAALAGFVAFAAWPRPARVTRENVLRIRPGMSLAAVEEILGKERDGRTGPTTFDPNRASSYKPFAPANCSVITSWRGDADEVTVCFRPDEGVVSVLWNSVTRVDQSLFENLHWRVRRLWRRVFPNEDPFAMTD